jgi:hypothetical protein
MKHIYTQLNLDNLMESNLIINIIIPFFGKTILFQVHIILEYHLNHLIIKVDLLLQEIWIQIGY